MKFTLHDGPTEMGLRPRGQPRRAPISCAAQMIGEVQAQPNSVRHTVVSCSRSGQLLVHRSQYNHIQPHSQPIESPNSTQKQTRKRVQIYVQVPEMLDVRNLARMRAARVPLKVSRA